MLNLNLNTSNVINKLEISMFCLMSYFDLNTSNVINKPDSLEDTAEQLKKI